MNPIWLELLNASLAGRPEGPLLMTLATVDDLAVVDARTVVCREIAQDGSLWFTSDSRSAKNAQLAKNPIAAAVIWLAHCRRQFRFQGSVDVVEEPTDRRRFWLQLPDATKTSFFWPPPGTARAPIDVEVPALPAEPPQTFSVLRMKPVLVDLLELEFTPHRRRRWQAAQMWRAEELNP
jgi:hypothetical protein